MGRKHLIYGYKMFDAADLSEATLTSEVVEVGQLDYGSIFVEWDSTAINGVITVQARNGDDGSWFNINFGDTITCNVDDSNHQLVMNELGFTHLRLVYTRTAGTGTIDAFLTLKSKGA